MILKKKKSLGHIHKQCEQKRNFNNPKNLKPEKNVNSFREEGDNDND